MSNDSVSPSEKQALFTAPPAAETLRAMNAAKAAERMAHVQEARQKGELPPSSAGPDASPAPHVEPLRFVSAAHIKTLPPVSWRVKNLLPAQGVAAIYGPPASGKSFLALDMAAAIASGRDWFGHKTAAAPVFYINLEGSGALKNRIAAWEQERERGFPDGVVFFLDVFNLFENMDSLVAAIPHGAVVVVDTLAASAPGFDENSGADMSRVIEALSRVARERNGLALVVHHSGKDASRGLRGHSSLLGALDAAICVDRSGASSVRRWTATKVKDGEDGIGAAFSLHRVELGTDADGDMVSSCIVRRVEGEQREISRLSSSMRYALDSLKKALAGEESVHVEKWREGFYSGHTADNIRSKKTAFKRARANLRDAGLADVTNDEYYLTPQGKKVIGVEVEQTETAPRATRATRGDKGATCTPRHSLTGGRQGRHTPIGVSPVSPLDAPDAVAGKKTDSEQTVCRPASSRKAEE